MLSRAPATHAETVDKKKDEDEKTMEMRRAIANRLKAEVLGKWTDRETLKLRHHKSLQSPNDSTNPSRDIAAHAETTVYIHSKRNIKLLVFYAPIIQTDVKKLFPPSPYSLSLDS